MEQAEKLHSVISEKKFVEFCEEKIALLAEADDKANLGVWEYLKLLFESDPRAALLSKLGFDPEKMSSEVSSFLDSLEKNKKGKSSTPFFWNSPFLVKIRQRMKRRQSLRKRRRRLKRR